MCARASRRAGWRVGIVLGWCRLQSACAGMCDCATRYIGFVEFDSYDDAEAACKGMHKSRMPGSTQGMGEPKLLLWLRCRGVGWRFLVGWLALVCWFVGWWVGCYLGWMDGWMDGCCRRRRCCCWLWCTAHNFSLLRVSLQLSSSRGTTASLSATIESLGASRCHRGVVLAVDAETAV